MNNRPHERIWKITWLIAATIYVLVISSLAIIVYNLPDITNDSSGTTQSRADAGNALGMNTTYDIRGQPGFSCNIPRTPPVTPYLNRIWNPNFVHNCSYERANVQLVDEETLSLLDPKMRAGCCVQEIFRGRSDAEFSLTDCKRLESHHHFVRDKAVIVKCGNSINGEVNLGLNPSVAAKIRHWDTKKVEERPLSVFLLGIDTISRAHAYRSIPKTIQILRAMGFIEFTAYHSAGPSTLSNMMAFLGGLSRQGFRDKCAPDWKSNFDSCQLIWKEFSEHRFITSYIEDGVQSFNWGGKSGFHRQPTDYYWHHFFNALNQVRTTQFKKLKLNEKNFRKDCVSNESVPEFMLRYSQRFLKKFSKIPSFLMTWLADPFHDEIYSLAAFDDTLSKFFQTLQNRRDVLNRTFIIFLSDHGDRFSEFSGKSIESFIERVSPPLFIRMPEILYERQPQMFRALQENSAIFTTPFDLYQTFRHIISMSAKTWENQEPVVGIGSTLLLPVGKNRSCTDLKIPAMHCLCNVQYSNNQSFSLSKQFTPKILQLAVRELNLKVQESAYRNVCSVWSSTPDDVIYASEIGRAADQTEIVVAFHAAPGRAQFEARLKITLANQRERGRPREDSVSFVGLSRTNKYHDQSWCVGFVHDSDKIMKELCHCREPPPQNYRQNYIEKFFKLM